MVEVKKLIIDLNPLFSGIKSSIEFSETVNFPAEDLRKTSIKKLADVVVSGKIVKISDYSINLTMEIKTKMTLEDSVTLEELEYPVNIQFNKIIDCNEEEDGYFKILQNRLDILPIVWENIVLEVPLRIVKEEKETIIEGDGWSLNKKESDTPLSDLKELLDMEERR